MSRLPNFMIIGAMKSATSTLHDQLALQPGIVMSDPKEPYFFSDDPIYAKGMDWYTSLFAHALPTDLCGESTTHYTKLPTYPLTVERIQKHVPDAKFIYIMRHPVDRLVSQYIHHWTMRETELSLQEMAADESGILINYSQYTTQLQPFFDTFGQDRVLPLFFDRLHTHPQAVLEQVCHFIGYNQQPTWQTAVTQQNKSSERMRVSPIRDMIVEAPVLRAIRKNLIPPSVRNRIKTLWTMRNRPELAPAQREHLESIFDQDLAKLGQWLSVDLTCANFKAVTRDKPLTWATQRSILESG